MNTVDGPLRRVFLLGPLAVKVPRLSPWPSFLEGLSKNLREVAFRDDPDCPCRSSLCPVVFSAPLGLAVVMARVRPLTDGEWRAARAPTFLRIMTGGRRDSFGRLPDGRTVAVDYGLPPSP